MTRYGFRQAVGAFFVAETRALSRYLPAGLFPLEARPGCGVLAITAFDFVDSEVGPYGELVLSVVVPPWAGRDEELPETAFFPFFLGTTTEVSREHARDRWLLPAHDVCLSIDITRSGVDRRVRAAEHGEEILSLTTPLPAGPPSTRLYQCFSADAGSLHRVGIQVDGGFRDAEEELGRLELSHHGLAREIAGLLEDDIPFREQAMDAGEQRFGELEKHMELVS
ncbi:MAG: hypothetical protein AAF628_10320 [Planctomycetota bacterium]